MTTFLHDPNEVLDYKWSCDWLAAGETITTRAFVVPSGITKTQDSNDTTSITAWFTGGTAGEIYRVVYRATTNQGRTKDKTLRLRIVEH